MSVETPDGTRVQDLLSDVGWSAGEPWTPLRRDLTGPVEETDMRIEVIGPEQAHVRTAVQRASFNGSTFTDERWRAMAAGLPYAGARCLVGVGQNPRAVAHRITAPGVDIH